MGVRAFVLGVVLAWLWVVTPFRLLALGVDTFRYRPSPVRLAQTHNAYWRALELEGRLVSMGWKVGYAPNLVVQGDAAYGVTNPEEHIILVDSSLAWDARFAVLAHEGGHTLAPGWMPLREHECFAEGVSYLVARDGLAEHARYLASLRWTCLSVYLTEFPAVYKAAAILEE